MKAPISKKFQRGFLVRVPVHGLVKVIAGPFPCPGPESTGSERLSPHADRAWFHVAAGWSEAHWVELGLDAEVVERRKSA